MTHAAALFLDGHRSGPTLPRYPDARRRWSRTGREAIPLVAEDGGLRVCFAHDAPT